MVATTAAASAMPAVPAAATSPPPPPRASAGYRWPAEVILAAVRWYLSYPLSIRQVTELLAERGIDVSPRTVLTWAHSFGPQLCWRPGDGVPKGKGLGAPAAK